MLQVSNQNLQKEKIQRASSTLRNPQKPSNHKQVHSKRQNKTPFSNKIGSQHNQTITQKSSRHHNTIGIKHEFVRHNNTSSLTSYRTEANQFSQNSFQSKIEASKGSLVKFCRSRATDLFFFCCWQFQVKERVEEEKSIQKHKKKLKGEPFGSGAAPPLPLAGGCNTPFSQHK